MAERPEIILHEWNQSDRPLLIIDETRRFAGEGEYVLYVAVTIRTKNVLTYLQEIQKIRSTDFKQNPQMVIKGKDLFGSHQKHSRENLKKFVQTQLETAVNTTYLLTTSNAIKETAIRSVGGILTVASVNASQPSGRVSGPELIPLLNFVKRVSRDLELGARQVDVLIDRSAQLGLAGKARNVSDDRFETFGPDTFNNKADGSASEVICPSPFFLISASEKGMFKDLLLLPDTAAYLYLHKGDLDLMKGRLSASAPFWVWHAFDRKW